MSKSPKAIAAEKEVSQNYEYFLTMLPQWRQTHPTHFALLHNQQLVDFYETENDAIKVGVKDFGWGHFSVQPVNETPMYCYRITDGNSFATPKSTQPPQIAANL